MKEINTVFFNYNIIINFFGISKGINNNIRSIIARDKIACGINIQLPKIITDLSKEIMTVKVNISYNINLWRL